jgi:hypothetical protein
MSQPIYTAYLPEYVVANLSNVGTLTVTLDSAGAVGTVTAYLEHYNNILGAWASLTDVIGARTSLGAVTSGVALTVPAFTARAGEKLRISLDFQSTDGTAPAPASGVCVFGDVVTDSSAPAAPTIALVKAVSGSNFGFLALFNQPTGAHHVTLQKKLNSGAWVAVGDSTKTSESFDGYSTGDVVQVQAKAVDAVGNESAYTDSAELTLTADVLGEAPKLYIEDVTVFNAETATLRVHLTGISPTDVTVTATSVEGTATAPEIFTAIGPTVLTFAGDPSDGHRWQDITVNGVGTTPAVGTTAYTVLLSAPTGATLEKASGTVTVKTLDYIPVYCENLRFRVSSSIDVKMRVRT